MKRPKSIRKSATGPSRARAGGKRSARAADAKPSAAPSTCGDFGGVTEDKGEKCQLPANWGRRGDSSLGRCSLHAAEADAKRAADKARFLELIESGEESLKSAAQKAGHAFSTIWRWRLRDAAFDAAYAKAREQSDGIRVAIVEDSLFDRIVAGKAHAAEVVFWLKNRGPNRWKDRQDIGFSGTLDVNADDVRQELAEKIHRVANFARTNGRGDK